MLLIFSLQVIPFAYANPIPMGAGKSSLLVIWFLFALVAEVAVTLLVLKQARLRFTGLGLAYLAVNLVSYALFFSVILPAFMRAEWLQPFSLVVAEACVIILETLMLLMFVNMDIFRKESSGEVRLLHALAAVTAGNLTSVFVGFFIIPMRPLIAYVLG